MASDAAKLLDELMGRERDLAANEKGVELDWSDDKVTTALAFGDISDVHYLDMQAFPLRVLPS
jgi:hypothetical protein